MSQNKNWFVHIGGEIFGPVATEVITVMLRQTRLQFTDFIWNSSLTKWVRIIDVDDFVGMLPNYPRTPIPSTVGKKMPRPVEEVPEEHFIYDSEEEEVGMDEEEEKTPVPKRASTPPPPPPPSKKVEKKIPANEPRSGSLSGKITKSSAKLSVFPRIKLSGKIKIDGIGNFKVIDISEGGVFVAASESIEIGTEVNFTLDADIFGESLSMAGVVIRHGDRYDEKGFAIEFLRVNPAYKRLIKNSIAKGLEEG